MVEKLTLGTPQHNMADLLDISQATYNNWLNGHTTPSSKHYPQIAKVELDVGELISPNATVIISSTHSNENNIAVNARELYEDFNEHLKEVIQLQKIEIERLQKRVTELEVTIVLLQKAS